MKMKYVMLVLILMMSFNVVAAKKHKRKQIVDYGMNDTYDNKINYESQISYKIKSRKHIRYKRTYTSDSRSSYFLPFSVNKVENIESAMNRPEAYQNKSSVYRNSRSINGGNDNVSSIMSIGNSQPTLPKGSFPFKSKANLFASDDNNLPKINEPISLSDDKITPMFAKKPPPPDNFPIGDNFIMSLILLMSMYTVFLFLKHRKRVSSTS